MPRVPGAQGQPQRGAAGQSNQEQSLDEMNTRSRIRSKSVGPVGAGSIASASSSEGYRRGQVIPYSPKTFEDWRKTLALNPFVSNKQLRLVLRLAFERVDDLEAQLSGKASGRRFKASMSESALGRAG